MSIDDWNMENSTDIKVSDLDALIEQYIQKKDEYDVAKKVSSDLKKEMDTMKYGLIETMMEIGKTKYAHEEIGNINVVLKKTVKVPKDFEGKQAAFDHLEKEMGREAFINKFTLNSMSLNSYFKEQLEIDPNYEIPGVGGLTEVPELRVRRK